MSIKMKLSAKATKQLETLATNLDLRRNIVCRMALAVSLNEKTAPKTDDADFSGQEFNKPTIMGTEEQLFNALIIQHYGRKLPEEELFSKYVRAEIINGLEIMTADYSKINSPVQFLEKLCRSYGEIDLQKEDL